MEIYVNSSGITSKTGSHRDLISVVNRSFCTVALFSAQYSSHFSAHLQSNPFAPSNTMKNTYFDLIDQSYEFPQDGFDLREGYLEFHGVSLKYLIEKYGTPFRLIYLPRIGEQIRRAGNLFRRAMKKRCLV